MEVYKFQQFSDRSIRHRIEDDLIIRQKSSRRKLEILKNKKLLEEMKNNRFIPMINQNSKRIANLIEKKREYSPTQVERTFQAIQNSRFFPKKVKISLESLEVPSRFLKIPSKFMKKYKFSAESPRIPSPITYPSLEQFNKSTSPPLPNDISQRNNLLLNLRQEVISKGFEIKHEDPNKGIHERGKIWQENRYRKIENIKKINETKILNECTFAPEILNKRYQSNNTTQRNLSLETSYTEIFLRKKQRISRGNYRNGIQSAREISGANTERNYQNIEEGSNKHEVLSERNKYEIRLKDLRKENIENSYRKIGLKRKNETDSDSLDKFSSKFRIESRNFMRNDNEIGVKNYEGLCPVDLSISYANGYSHQLLKKSQPMIDYTRIKFNS